MSRVEINRFIEDVNSDDELHAEVTRAPAGAVALVKIARAHGYDVTLDDVREHVRAQRVELTDEELDRIAAGAVFQQGWTMGSTFGIKGS